MSLIGLDLSSSRVRAAGGNGRQAPARLALERDSPDFPLAVSLEGKAPEPGSAGVRLTRLRPHAACLDFLSHLGTARTWPGPRTKVTASEALALVLAAVARTLGRVSGVALSVPSYLDEAQVALVHQAVEAAGLPLFATLAAPQAATFTRLALDPMAGAAGSTLVVDVDGHGLTWSVVEVTGGRCLLNLVRTSPALGRGAWLRRLLDGAANRFIRQSRHDPRESALTEQSLYDQLLLLLGLGQWPSLVPLAVQGDRWSHHLLLPADDLVGFVGPCLRQAATELDSLLTEAEVHGGIGAAAITGPAAALPGLAALVRSRVKPKPPADEADYGEAIVRTLGGDPVRELGPDALAATAYDVAVRVHGGLLPRGHLTELPLSSGAHAAQPDAGPARLQFRGEDHVLSKSSFVLGRDPSCDMVFESELYPHVSARHCEIVLDRRAYLLYDRSRHGTMLNDRPVDKQAALHSGDWIRLGPRGPVLRFLGVAIRG
jgi:hypothetical protein